MNCYRLPILACLVLVVAACLVAVNNVSSSGADTSPNSWLDRTIETSKRADLSNEEFNTRASSSDSFDCVAVKAEEWVSTPVWVWTPSKVWVSNDKCLFQGASGYFGVDDTSYFVVPFGTTHIQRLNYDIGTYVSLNSHIIIKQVANTNKLAVFDALCGLWCTPGPRNFHIVDNWNDTYTVNSQLSGVGNPQRTQTKDYDFTLSEAGQPVNGVLQDGFTSSANGEWVHVRVQDKANIILNTTTHQLIPYDTYRSTTYSTHAAISNNGRFVALTTDLSSLKIFDTSRCGAYLGSTVSRNCQSKELLGTSDQTTLLRGLFPGKDVFIGRVNFIGNGDALDVDVRVGDSTNYEFYTYRLKPSGSEPVKYLAMGDSFSSGEGAFDYLESTDMFVSDDEYNVCHVSRQSYPYLLQKDLRADWFHSVACSGSESDDVVYKNTNELDYINSKSAQAKVPFATVSLINQYTNSMRPGYAPQNEFVRKYNPNIITISIGGNDVGFADIIKSCIFHGINLNQTCFSTREERESKANEIDQKISVWSQNFIDIKNSLEGSDPMLYVIGYPKIISTDLRMKCGLNVPFDDAERLLTDRLVDYLNTAVKVAADAAGVRYVDVSDALYRTVDRRLCGGSSDFAVNGLDARSIINECPSAKASGVSACPNSFHPNQLGQKLMAEVIASRTADLNLTMPQNSNSMADLIDKRMTFVGDVAITLQNHRITYQKDIAPALITKGEKIQINIPKASEDLPAKAGTTATATVHSTPVDLGQLPISADGTISGEITLPSDIETAYHRLIISYTDIADNTVEKYVYFYAAQSSDDWDGDGITNVSDLCVSVPQSGIDQDEDGIDDACDGEYVKETQIVTVVHNSGNNSQSPHSGTSDTSKTNIEKEALLFVQDTSESDIFQSPATITPLKLPKHTDSASIENEANDASLNKSPSQFIWTALGVGIILVLGILMGLVKAARSRS